MTIATKRLALAALAAMLTATVVSAMMPWPRESIPDVEDGKAAPFVGNWSMVLAGQPDTTYATCELPVRIEAADDTHIFYVGPKDPEPEAATELVSRDGRTAWLPIAGGPQYFAVWVHPDRFHLYDADVEEAVDWGEPYAFTRCD
jgi:hypothetical protein